MEDLITQLTSLLPLQLQSCCHGQQSFLFSFSSLFHTLMLFSTLTICSHIIASFIGKYGNLLQHSCQNGDLNHATNYGISGATIKLVVGYCH